MFKGPSKGVPGVRISCFLIILSPPKPLNANIPVRTLKERQSRRPGGWQRRHFEFNKLNIALLSNWQAPHHRHFRGSQPPFTVLVPF